MMVFDDVNRSRVDLVEVGGRPRSIRRGIERVDVDRPGDPLAACAEVQDEGAICAEAVQEPSDPPGGERPGQESR
jgi:hypothetical protein